MGVCRGSYACVLLWLRGSQKWAYNLDSFCHEAQIFESGGEGWLRVEGLGTAFQTRRLSRLAQP